MHSIEYSQILQILHGYILHWICMQCTDYPSFLGISVPDKVPFLSTMGQMHFEFPQFASVRLSECELTCNLSEDFQNAGTLKWPGGRSSVAGRPRSFRPINHDMTLGCGRWASSDAAWSISRIFFMQDGSQQFNRESADRGTDGRYQTYYLPCFAVDNKH